MKKIIEKFKNWITKEKMFNLISIIFLTTCCIFYGYRAIYYKNKLNSDKVNETKENLLINNIDKTTVQNGIGLHNENGSLIYKGQAQNNYLKFSGYIFRIISINPDNSIKIIMDDPLNYLMYDKEIKDFNESNINDYLNTYFIKNLNQEYLLKNIVCLDKINNINDQTCLNKNYDSSVSLLSINEYLNSKIDNKSYLDDEDVLLLNRSDDKVWTINNENLSLNNVSAMLKIKPVLLLTNKIKFINGTGTKDDPYNIDESIYNNSYIKIKDDMYKVYNIDGNILKLVSEDNSKNYKTVYSFNEETNLTNNSIIKYLNDNILKNLEYKEDINECSWNYGEYNGDYKTILKNKIESKISLLNVIDPILNYDINDYYFINTINNHAYIYDKFVTDSPKYLNKNIRWTICIDKTKIKNGNGSKNNPYRIEE